VIKSLQE